MLRVWRALMVIGLVILLWVNEFFSLPVVAVGRAGNAACSLLAGGGSDPPLQLAGRA